MISQKKVEAKIRKFQIYRIPMGGRSRLKLKFSATGRAVSCSSSDCNKRSSIRKVCCHAGPPAGSTLISSSRNYSGKIEKTKRKQGSEKMLQNKQGCHRINELRISFQYCNIILSLCILSINLFSSPVQLLII